MSKLYQNDRRTFKERVRYDKVEKRTLYLAIHENGKKIGQILAKNSLEKRMKDWNDAYDKHICSKECMKLGRCLKMIPLLTTECTFETLEKYGETRGKEHLDKIEPREFHTGGKYDNGLY